MCPGLHTVKVEQRRSATDVFPRPRKDSRRRRIRQTEAIFAANQGRAVTNDTTAGRIFS